MDIHLETTPARVERYQALLREDWSLATLRKAVDLAADLTGIRFVGHAPEDPDLAPPREYPISPQVGADYRERLEELNMHLRQEHAAKRARRSGRMSADQLLAWQCSIYLTLPIWLYEETVSLKGDIGFFNDVRSIIFQIAATELLPKLVDTHPMNALHSALQFHATHFWDESPAHQHYLRSVYHQAVGNTAGAERELLAAFRATAPDDPDYLEKAYAYWSILADQDKHSDARTFALRVYRAAPTEVLPGVEEMVDASYQALLGDP